MLKKIAYVTDLHLDEEFIIGSDITGTGIDTRKNWITVLNDISLKGINNIIIGGDIGENSAHSWFFETLKNFNFLLTLGNHDKYNEIRKYFNQKSEKKTKLYYLNRIHGYTCIFLDSSSELICNDQIDWLERQLLTFEKILIFIHHPIIGVNIEVDKKYSLNKRSLISNKIFELENEIRVFCGHYHCDDEKKVNNLYQYVTPAVSYQAKKITKKIELDTNTFTFGYRIINLESSKTISTDLILFSK